jgi:hypothetical protein
VQAICNNVKANPALKSTLLFNSSSASAQHSETKAHMKKIEQLVQKNINAIGNRLKAIFSDTASFVINL